MMKETKIRWATSTWNPMVGCDPVTYGCDNCYAKRMAETLGPPAFKNGFRPTYKPHKLRDPVKWREPRRIFVDSMSDLFHRAYTEAQIDSVFDVMMEVPRHTYMILTKRPERMEHYITGWLDDNDLQEVPAHIWLGTSIESDAFVRRADVLRQIPVPVRFISAEPLLTPLPSLDLTDISWLIVGGESGSHYRPMDHAWARDLRDFANAGGTAFYFKQSAAPRTEMGQLLDGERWEQYPDGETAAHGAAPESDAAQIPLPGG